MKRALIICLFWAISLNAATSEGLCAPTNMFPPLQPLKPVDANGFSNNNGSSNLSNPYSIDPYMANSNVSYPKISEIERSLYGKNYPKQDILLRLARIEKSIFSTSYPSLSLAQRVDNIIMNFNQINNFPNISKNTLSEIEAKILKKRYGKNNVEDRIARLEQQVFGAIQSGDITARFETLQEAAKNYVPSQQDSICNQNPFGNPNRGWKGFVGNLGNMLSGGSMTGFTPPIIDPYDTYNNSYNNSPYNNNTSGLYSGFNNFASIGSPSGCGSYSGYRSNCGYSDTFKDYGAGSRVTILD